MTRPASPTPVAPPPVSRGFIALYGLAAFGFYVAVLAPVAVSFALRTGQLFPQTKAQALSAILGWGALVSVVASPIFGRLSDRHSRLGRRRPFMIGGVLVGVLGLLLVGTVTTVPLMLAGWCLAQLGFGAAGAALSAVMADLVPDAQRGRVGGVLVGAFSLGVVAGVFVAQALQASPVWMFVAPGLLAALLVAAFALFLGERDRPAAPGTFPPLRPTQFLTSFWVNPRAAPDFWWAFWGRFMLILGLATLGSFQAFFLQDHLGVPLPQVGFLVFVSTLISTATSVLGSVIGGVLSDRTGRRKVFVIVSALLYALALVLVAQAGTLRAFFAGVALAGFGQGVYLAVDTALINAVLPRPEDAAKDLALFNIANTLPQSLAPALAPAILAIGAAGAGTGNYTALFTAAALSAVIGGALIQPIRRVR